MSVYSMLTHEPDPDEEPEEGYDPWDEPEEPS